MVETGSEVDIEAMWRCGKVSSSQYHLEKCREWPGKGVVERDVHRLTPIKPPLLACMHSVPRDPKTLVRQQA